MFIQSNIEAMQSYLSFTRIDSAFNKSLAKLSSGMNLPAPSFNGGLFAAANDMEALYGEYTTGAANIEDALGLLEVAQTTMLEANDKLLEMNDLAHRAASGVLNDDQRVELNAAFVQLKTDIQELYADVRYNDLALWTTGASNTFSVTYGEGTAFTINTYLVTSAGIGYTSTIDTVSNANGTMTVMASAIDTMSQRLAELGAQISKVQAKANIVEEQAVQQKAMESRINELDFAKEMKNFTSLQVVLQASNAMVAQANMKPQMVMQLFGG